MDTLTIDSQPLAVFEVSLNPDVSSSSTIVQLTGSRDACKRLIFHLGCELRQRARYGLNTYRLYDDQGEYCGQFHDFDIPQLVFHAGWFQRQA